MVFNFADNLTKYSLMLHYQVASTLLMIKYSFMFHYQVAFNFANDLAKYSLGICYRVAFIFPD